MKGMIVVAVASAVIGSGPAVAWAQAQGRGDSDAAASSAQADSSSGAQSGNRLNTGVSGPMTDKFIKAAAQDGDTEIALAQVAEANSQSPDVKSFAQRMIADHGKADNQLKDIAASKGITVPTDMDTRQRAMIARLRGMHGSAFDAAYAKAMQQDHTKAVAMFKRAAQNMHLDSDVRDFAQQTLPTLSDHLQLANNLVNAHAMNGKSAMTSSRGVG
jgi:putative membrane protein